MTKTAYVFLLVVIGLALLLHAADEKSDRDNISKAASIALHDGVLAACEERNKLRESIIVTAVSLHPESRRDTLRKGLLFEDCDALSDGAVVDFFRRLNAGG